MNTKILIAVITVFLCSYAENNKFNLYGFSDMSITKYFPKDASFSRGIDRMDERTYFGLDHMNLYFNLQPNSRLRFLTELSFQDKPADYLNTAGSRIIIPPFYDSTWTVAKTAPKNKTMKGIVNYEWGSFSVERAVFTVDLNQYFNLSFGKFITPAGIWNVDHGSPVIMTILQPTEYSHDEIYPKSQLGIMEDGKFFIGDADLSYSIYLSSGRDNQTLNQPQDVSVGGQFRLALPLLDELNFGISGYTGRVDTKLRTQVTTMIFTDPTDFSKFTSTTDYIDNTTILYREKVYGCDLRLRKWRTTIQAELNYQHLTDFLKNDATSGTLGTYVIGSVDAFKSDNLKITPYAYYERVKYFDPIDNPNNNGMVTSKGYHKFMGGLNIQAFSNYGIKLEYNFTRINLTTKDPDKLADIPGIGSQFYIAF
jgi:hypothetical protein